MNLRRNTAIAILVIALLVLTAGIVAATMIPNAQDLLTQSLESLESVNSGYAKGSITAQLPDQDISGTFEMWAELDAGPNGEPAVRLVVLEASMSELKGMTFVSDGSQFWLYDPNRAATVVGQAEEMGPLLAERLTQYEGQWEHGGDISPDMQSVPQTPAEAVAELLQYVSAERNGSDQVAGYEADRLRLLPIAEMLPEELRLAGGYINLWLRASDQLPLAAEYAEGTVGYFKIEASQLSINEPIASEIFSFDIPAGTEVVRATELLTQMEALKQSVDPAEIGALTPSELPEGAELAGSEQLGNTVVQRFQLPEGRSFYVAQGPDAPKDAPGEATSNEAVTVRGVTGAMYTNEDATRSLLTWQEDGTFLLVGGDLSPEQALALAESLQ